MPQTIDEDGTVAAPDERTRVGRPSKQQLQSSYGATIPDLGGPDTSLLLVGINPSLYSGWLGAHFARPGNRLWRTLKQAGFTAERLDPLDITAIQAAGLGITNLVARATARADELDDDEIRAGLEPLGGLVRAWQPGWVAFLGISTYRIAFAAPKATVGPQPERFEGAKVWMLPNPSGLNAHYQQPALTAAYTELRVACASSRK